MIKGSFGNLGKALSLFLSLLILAVPIVAQENWQQETIAKAKKQAGQDAPGFIFGIYGCMAPLIVPLVVGSGWMYKPSPPPTAVVGKSPEYVALFTETYQRHMQKAAAKWAWYGSAVGCLFWVALSVLTVFAAEEAYQPYYY